MIPCDVDEVRNRFPSDFSFLQNLLGSAPMALSVNVRAANQSAGLPAALTVAAGFELNIGSPRSDTEWESFQENFLFGGADWGVAIDPAIVQQVLNKAFTALVGTEIAINQQTEDFFLERFLIETISGTYGDPIQIHVRGEVIKSGPNLDVEFDLTGRFVIQGRILLLALEMAPGSLDVDTWDGVQTVFSDPLVIAAAIVGALPGVGITSPAVTSSGLHAAIMIAIRFGGGGPDPSFPIDPLGLGPVEFQLNDGSRFIGTSVVQFASGLIILGSATVPDPIAPRLVLLGDLEFVETHDSACAGGEPVFPAKDLVFVNEGELPLRICSAQGPANPNFQVTRNWEPPVTIPPGSGRGMTIRYTGGRGANAADTIRVTCNDPRQMIREIPLLARAGGQAAYQVDPSPVVEVLAANTPTGRPVARMGRCRAIADPGRAAEFTVRNTGDGVLFLCQGVLEDPDGVFVVSYSSETLLPNRRRTYPILFYPTEVMRDYHATFRIQSNAGEIVVPIHGRVEALPAPTTGGAMAYLPTDELCVPPDVLCRVEPLFERSPGGGSILVQMISFFDMPPGGELVLSDPTGTMLVHDYSRHGTRNHALAYTPNPDGTAGPGQACVPDFRGMSPGDGELVRIRVSGWAVLPVEDFPELENVTSIASAGSWVYAGTPDGLAVLDWRETKQPQLRNRIGIGPIQGLALSGARLFAASGDEIIKLDLERREHPVPRDTAKLDGVVTALGASRGRLFVLDGKRISAFEFGEGKLLKKSSEALPEDVGQIGLFRDGVYVAGEKTLAVYSLDERLQLGLADRASVEQPIETLSHFGRNIFLSGKSGTRVFELVGKNSSLRAIADYRQRHWTVDFLPDLEHRRLFKLGPRGQVELWQLHRRRLDRSRFQDSLKLRYLPKRPEGRDVTRS